MDEFELEVSDLRQAGPPSQPSEALDAESTSHAAADRWEWPVGTPVRGDRAARADPRPRAAAVGALLLVVACALLLSIPNAPATLGALLRIPTPMPTATLAIGADTLILEHDVPWGLLTIDGHTTVRGSATQPSMPQGRFFPTIQLARGRHTLHYAAPPFPPLSCTISVPAMSTDTCPLTGTHARDPVHAFAAARVIDLGATVQRLPADQLAALTRVTGQLLRASSAATAPTTGGGVLPGESYLRADGTRAVARVPLTATLQLDLDTSGT